MCTVRGSCDRLDNCSANIRSHPHPLSAWSVHNCLSESRLCHTLVFIDAVWADMMWIENVNMLVRFCWSFIPVIAVRRACPKYSLILRSGLQGYICFWIHLLHTEANLNAIGIVEPSPPWPHPVAEEPQTADSTWAKRTGDCFKFWGISYTPLL